MSVSLNQEASASLILASVVAGVLLYSSSSIFSSSNKRQLPKDTVLPPHVWSTIPFLGSAIEMGAGVTEFIRKYSRKRNNAPVFTATILGDQCCFIADPEYLTVPFKAKYAKYLDSRSLQKQFVVNVLGANEQETEETFRPDVGKVGFPQYHQYLFKGDELQTSMDKVQKFLQKSLPQLLQDTDGIDSSWVKHNLYDLAVRSIFLSTLNAVISNSPELATDEMYQHFRTFDKSTIPLFNNLPQFLTSKGRQARSFLYQKLQSPEFWNNLSGLMKAREQKLLKELQLTKSTIDKANMGFLWASVGNTAPAVFWTLFLLLEHSEAWEACRTQVDAVASKRQRLNGEDGTTETIFTLDDLDELTYLESAFRETLRLYNGTFTARRVVQDFVLETPDQKYLIEKGTKLMSWWGLLHHDPDVFQNAEQFQFDRFLGVSKENFSYRNGKSLTHEPVMPFGGGEQLCPGRKLASYEARLFVAMLMQRFDMRLAQGEHRPGIDKSMIGISICHPDREPKIEMRPRKPTMRIN